MDVLPAGTREVPRSEGRADFVSVADAKDELEEALGLVEAMGHGWRVVSSEILSVTGTVGGRSNHLFGTGQMASVADKVRWMKRQEEQGGALDEAEDDEGERRRRRRRRAAPERPVAVFVNVEQLRPDQQRAMQASWGCPVLDRFLVVLQIFKARATTREAMLRLEMVEVDIALAHLIDPDAVRGEVYAKLDQQRGGGGGATRGGPGEKVIEVKRSQLRQRHATLRKRLAAASERAAELRRQERERRTLPVVALVGYTNAGKSELQARLVGAAARSEPRRAHDALFASLDTHARRGRLPDGTEALFVDTVGFVRRLSHRLVGCFRDTLRAACDADVLVHVVDFASPHAAAQRAAVLQTLHELAVPPETLEGLVTAHNKCDKLDASERQRWEAAQRAGATPRGAVMCSALLGDGCDELAALIARRLRAKQGRSKRELRLDVDGPDGHTGAGGVLEQQVAYLHRHPRVAVLEQRMSRCGTQLVVTAEIDEETFLRFRGRRWHAEPSGSAASAA